MPALGSCPGMKLDNTIIYLIGIPAVGKYTVAREIGRMTGARVVDNQLVNTPVFSVLGYDGTAAVPFPPARRAGAPRPGMVPPNRTSGEAEASRVLPRVAHV